MTLAATIDRLVDLPFHRPIATFALRRTVPFRGTAGVRFVRAGPGSATLALDPKRRVHNHIRGVHAGAAALLAEATSGLCLAYHLPDGARYLLTRMEIDFVQRMRGGLTATARLDEATQRRLRDEAAGEVTVDVEVRDARDDQPLLARLTWAWRPSRATG